MEVEREEVAVLPVAAEGPEALPVAELELVDSQVVQQDLMVELDQVAELMGTFDKFIQQNEVD